MNKLKFIIISSIFIFLLNFPAHFMYNWFSYKLISYFFPVNESIFQHMKMVFTCFCLFYLGLSFMKRKLNFNNICLSLLIGSLITISTFLLFYIPFILIFKEIMIVTFILLFICIIWGQYIAILILESKDYKDLNYISLFIILIIIILNASLTYCPIKNFFFYDNVHQTYNFFK